MSDSTGENSPTLRIAIVGLGWVAQHRHIPTCRRSARYRVVGLMDRQAGKAASIASRLKIPYHYTGDSIEQIPWLDEVDAVSIASAPQTHHELIRQALQCGKHVITEKPFVMAPQEGKQLRTLARDSGLTLAIVHNFQFAESFKRLEQDLTLGRLGTIRHIVARQFSNPRRRLPVWYEQLPLGLFYDESPHLLYLIRRLATGVPTLKRVDLVTSASGLSTPTVLEALYTSGTLPSFPISLLMSFEAPVSEWFIVVMGEHACGLVDIFRDIYIRLPNDGQHETFSVLRTSLYASWQHWSQHLRSGTRHILGRLSYGNDTVFSLFADAVQHGRTPEGIDADDAVEVLEMQHEIISRLNAYSSVT
ncbi:MAG TPA: Gfo/Idh/MocA family oxidoreductase [Nevskiales bacterium]|nr:Gfo/Idh/MocA family oxidoreductase [Nevskiales bacterium]